jgi:hypothetical protein
MKVSFLNDPEAKRQCHVLTAIKAQETQCTAFLIKIARMSRPEVQGLTIIY